MWYRTKGTQVFDPQGKAVGDPCASRAEAKAKAAELAKAAAPASRKKQQPKKEE